MPIKSILAAALLLGSSLSMAECVNPDTPELPDGASADMKAMIAGQTAVKSFQAANIEYMACLDKIVTEAEAAMKAASGDEKAQHEATYNKALTAYNNAVSTEEAVAGQFNTEIREFKAANPS